MDYYGDNMVIYPLVHQEFAIENGRTWQLILLLTMVIFQSYFSLLEGMVYDGVWSESRELELESNTTPGGFNIQNTMADTSSPADKYPLVN